MGRSKRCIMVKSEYVAISWVALFASRLNVLKCYSLMSIGFNRVREGDVCTVTTITIPVYRLLIFLASYNQCMILIFVIGIFDLCG